MMIKELKNDYIKYRYEILKLIIRAIIVPRRRSYGVTREKSGQRVHDETRIKKQGNCAG